jgi:hypothetical protein
VEGVDILAPGGGVVGDVQLHRARLMTFWGAIELMLLKQCLGYVLWKWGDSKMIAIVGFEMCQILAKVWTGKEIIMSQRELSPCSLSPEHLMQALRFRELLLYINKDRFLLSRMMFIVLKDPSLIIFRLR